MSEDIARYEFIVSVKGDPARSIVLSDVEMEYIAEMAWRNDVGSKESRQTTRRFHKWVMSVYHARMGAQKG